MRNPKDKDEVLNSCEFYYCGEEDYIENKKTALEIGMGKGDFILGMAKAFSSINFIGVEKYSAVASVAIKKIREENLENLKVLVSDIVDVQDLLKNSIDVIYLNFSDPWPKDRHAKRRLTHVNQLQLYDTLFKGDAEIFMKTDNDDLFAYSVESFKDYGYEIIEISYDLHSTDNFNVITEYESKFSEKGVKIKFVHVKKLKR